MKRAAFLILLGLAAPATAFEGLSGVKATTVLKTTSTWDGAAIAYPGGTPEVTGMVVEIPVGGETGWHSHPVPSFGMILEGELEVRLESGAVKRMKAGDALAEVINTPHNGRNIGSVPVRLVVFYAGTAGKAVTIKNGAR